MGWVTAILMFALGVLGAAGIIAKKRPDAKASIEKLAKYGGYLGVFGALWGLWWIITAILNLGLLGQGLYGILLWATILASGVAMAALGIIFGMGLISSFMKGDAAVKGEQLRQKLLPFQSNLGILALIMGIWNILWYAFLWKMFWTVPTA